MGIQKAFSRVTVRDFIANVKALREREIVSISTNVTLKHTLDLLTSHNYTSCPVKGEDGQSWIGFVDMMDIVSWVIEGCVQSHATTTSAERTTPVLEWRIEEGVLERRGEELLTTPHHRSSILRTAIRFRQSMTHRPCPSLWWHCVQRIVFLFETLRALSNI
eukprot:c2858_g1_i1.p1 GENE.c2858_g1_i1~~c2858_g1_i1.p1  ORF type:complete len:162 (-),score=34.38 c2858_g1_i1:337-822(-)